MNFKERVALSRKNQKLAFEKKVIWFLVFIICIISVFTSQMINKKNMVSCENEVIQENYEELPEEPEAYVSQKDIALAKEKEEYRKNISSDISSSNKSEYYANTLAYNIVNVADMVGINPYLLASVVKTESNYTNKEENSVGAVGLAQVTPICVKEVERKTGVKYNRYNEIENLQVSAIYLKLLSQKFEDRNLIIAAYNAGETVVSKENSVPSIQETKAYVMKVNHNMQSFEL